LSAAAATWAARVYHVLAGADRAARRTLLAELRPRPADHALVFANGWRTVARDAYARLWVGDGPDFPDAEPGAIRVEIGPPREHGALAPVLHALSRRSLWGRVAPARGVELDGLVFLTDRVVWFPKPRLFLGHATFDARQAAMAHWAG
jgi:hypothetical protein